MKSFLAAVQGASRALSAVAGLALAALMLLTIADVAFRVAGRPIVGTYELVGLGGALAIGLSLPLTSWKRGHIYVDSFEARLPRALRVSLTVLTRLLVLGLFFLIGWNLLRYAGDLRVAGEGTPTLRVPFFPIAAAVGVSGLLQCLVMVADIVRIFRGEYE